jgi:hypothetical protein
MSKQANINVIYVLHVGHCVLILLNNGKLTFLILSECLIDTKLCNLTFHEADCSWVPVSCALPLAAKNSASQPTLLTATDIGFVLHASTNSGNGSGIWWLRIYVASRAIQLHISVGCLVKMFCFLFICFFFLSISI